MEGLINVNLVLDCAVFHVTPASKRYNAVAHAQGKSERVSAGLLDDLALHLPEVKRVCSDTIAKSFRLQVGGNPKDASWFTKSTLARFLHLVNSPEALKKAKAIEIEISQLDETRRFHLALYAKGHPEHFGDGLADGMLQGAGLANKLQLELSSSDHTKRELLQAVEFRLAALKEELVSRFNQAAGGATCFTQQVSDLVSFAQQFGAEDLRIFLVNYMAWCPKDQDTRSSIQHLPANTNPNGKCGISEQNIQETSRKDVINSNSQSKIADATRSGDSSESSDGEQMLGERSRPIIRSASPRRSASPMRRVQIGRSGSRKPTALSIKSLSHFPARERMPINRDADANSSDGEQTEEVRKKPENSARSMSVQDKINMFEGKQKWQNLDGHGRRASGEVSKLVLRRWSAGMGDSFNKSSLASVPDCNGCAQTTVTVPVTDVEDKWPAEVKVEPDLSADYSKVDGTPLDASTEVVEMPRTPSSSINNGSEVIEVADRAAAAAEWNKQKEVELNQMLLKMMENKPVKRQARNAAEGMRPESSDEQRGDFFVQYKEKRDERLRLETAKKREAKAAQFKVMQEALEQSKAEMAERSGLRGKQDPPAQSQRPLRRNSSPPLISKKDLLKPTGPRKASSKASPSQASPSPTIRTSSSTGQLPKTVGTPTSRTSPGVSPTGAALTRKKPQSTPSPTRPSPRTERPAQLAAKKGGAVTTAKPKTKGCAEKQLKSSSNESGKPARTITASQEDLSAARAKPTFYNKVTKKSTVVPLETKPSKKGRGGVGAGASPVTVKTKASQPVECPKNCESPMQVEEVEPATCTAVAKIQPEENSVQVHDDTVADEDVSGADDLGHLNAADQVQPSDPVNDTLKAAEAPVADDQSDGDMGITPAAWVEVEPRDVPTFDDKGVEDVIPPENVSAIFEPKIRHSLSQMLHADNSEPEIIDWGNAENPPALAYQKDAPKGLKRLLKFAARKSKGEANAVDWDAADDDRDDAKAAGKSKSDALPQKKFSSHAKGYEQQKAVLNESCNVTNSSKRLMDYREAHGVFSAQSNIENGPRAGNSAAATASSKSSRSFFSLPAFRSSK